MKQFPNALIGATLALACAAGFAQAAHPAANERHRDATQDQRIRQGEASGQLSAREAYRLERQQGRIDAAEAAAQADGRLTPEERARINRMQNQANRDIHQQKHDVNGAGSGSAMAPAAPPTSNATVDRRESTQDARIRQGIASGQINAQEAGRLEREQSRIDAAEAWARADGQVTDQEKARLNRMQNHANSDIYQQKHDKQRAH